MATKPEDGKCWRCGEPVKSTNSNSPFCSRYCTQMAKEGRLAAERLDTIMEEREPLPPVVEVPYHYEIESHAARVCGFCSSKITHYTNPTHCHSCRRPL